MLQVFLRTMSLCQPQWLPLAGPNVCIQRENYGWNCWYCKINWGTNKYRIWQMLWKFMQCHGGSVAEWMLNSWDYLDSDSNERSISRAALLIVFKLEKMPPSPPCCRGQSLIRALSPPSTASQRWGTAGEMSPSGVSNLHRLESHSKKFEFNPPLQ